jgi:hypothetical protein
MAAAGPNVKLGSQAAGRELGFALVQAEGGILRPKNLENPGWSASNLVS